MSMINFENSRVATLDIDVAFTNLIIKKGDFLIAETNNEDINCKQNNQNLYGGLKNEWIYKFDIRKHWWVTYMLCNRR